MPLTNAVRIWAMKREAERNLPAKLAEQEKNRTAQQALTVPAREPDSPDPALPEATAPAASDQGSGSDPGQHQDRTAAKESINWVSVTEQRTHIATFLLLTTARPLETVSAQLASTDRPPGQSPDERAMAPIDGQSTH